MIATVARALGLSGGVAQRVVEAYSEPYRAYHNVRHLEEVLSELGDAGPEIVLAALFHDFVYDPTRSDNELRSAEAMRALVPGAGDRAFAAILATQTHVTEDPAIMRLLDADLAILAAASDRYKAYARGIRREYAHVPDDAYRTGRAAVLRGFLDRPVIYRTRPDLEERARENLFQEIAGL